LNVFQELVLVEGIHVLIYFCLNRTYWGLVRALCCKKNPLPAQKAYELAIGGNKANIDMTVFFVIIYSVLFTKKGQRYIWWGL